MGGGHVIKNPAMHRDLPTAWTCDAHQQKESNTFAGIQTTSPHPTPSSPDPSLACPLKLISSLVLQLGWLSPFLLPSHPSAHRSEPPRISPGPHAQFTDVGAEAQRGWLPWGLTHVTGGEEVRSLVTKQCLNLPPAHSTCHGASWSTCDSHKLGKALLEADLALGLSKECPPPDH